MHWAPWRVLASHCAAPLSLLPLLHPEESDPGTVLAAGEPLLRAVAYHNYRGLYADALQELDALTTVRSARLGEDDPGTIEARLAGVWPLRGLGGSTRPRPSAGTSRRRATGRCRPTTHCPSRPGAAGPVF